MRQNRVATRAQAIAVEMREVGASAHPAAGVARAVTAYAVALAAATGFALAPDSRLEAAALGAGVMLAAGLVVFAGVVRDYPHPRFGLCNAATLARAGLVAGLFGVLASAGGAAASEATAWAVTAAATLALALDGLDGWVARREGLCSRFGARFDMEVDTALALTLALLIWHSGKLGPWVLLLGAPRHLFLAAGLLAPALRAALPPALWRKAGCVAQIAALIAALAPPLAPQAAMAVVIAGLGVVGAAFARDVAWLLRRSAPDAR